MRRITACMAALISLLFAFTSISVSACDLSCWLRQGQDDCHSGVSMSGEDAGTAMTSAMPMAMSSRQMQHVMAPDARAGSLDSLVNVSLEIGTPLRLMPMSPQMEMAVQRF